MEPIIVLRQVCRTFSAGSETLAVLSDISLTIHGGEMVAIVGASGSGKSTLMNIIGCLDKPSSGEVLINGTPVHDADSLHLADLRSRYLGFIFQRYHLMPYLTAEENIAIPALYTAMSAQERNARTQRLARQLGLENRLQHRPAQLSGGQQQRVSICRALINGAHIILADEPTGALDSVSGKALMDVLHQLHAAGHTVITLPFVVRLRWRSRITDAPRWVAVFMRRSAWPGVRCSGTGCARFSPCWGSLLALRQWCPRWR